MNTITVAGVTLNQTPMDWAGNSFRISSAIYEARTRGAAVVCLPELCTCGYGCEDALTSPDVWKRSWGVLQDALPRTRGIVACMGLPVFHRNAIFNGVAVCVNGRVAGIVAKRHLAGEGLHYEPRWFKPWPEGMCSLVDTPVGPVPMGDLHFEVGGDNPESRVKIGFEICEDAWVAQRPGGKLAALGVDLILNPSASHFAFGKIGVRERFVVEGSRAFGAGYIYANLLGNEAGRAIYDGGVLIASGGELIARGPRLTMNDWIVTTAMIDLRKQRVAQVRTASFQPALQETGLCVRVDAELRTAEQATVATAPATAEPAAWEKGAHVKEEEFTRAISLGLWDYLRKSRSRGFVVSLSGGADSAGVAVLIRTMAEMAKASLTEAEIARKAPAAAGAADAHAMVGVLLTTVYQAAQGSTESSRDAARSIAASLGAKHHEIDVGRVAADYRTMVEGALGRPLTWERDDLALQNIQARTRGPSVWMIANVLGALLLTTSNRSEAAVGYATMDGDTCGGLAPIAGIDKAFLLRWLRWMQATGPAGIGPIEGLRVITARTPTPELRPPEMNQTSEGDLMPYDVLEAIEDAAVGQKQSPIEVEATLNAMFPASTREQRVAWVSRFFVLWSRNQWKRERYAPSFHVDDHNLDPRSWCRFPILSGGYGAELAELKDGHRAEAKGGA